MAVGAVLTLTPVKSQHVSLPAGSNSLIDSQEGDSARRCSFSLPTPSSGLGWHPETNRLPLRGLPLQQHVPDVPYRWWHPRTGPTSRPVRCNMQPT